MVVAGLGLRAVIQSGGVVGEEEEIGLVADLALLFFNKADGLMLTSSTC